MGIFTILCNIGVLKACTDVGTVKQMVLTSSAVAVSIEMSVAQTCPLTMSTPRTTGHTNRAVTLCEEQVAGREGSMEVCERVGGRRDFNCLHNTKKQFK